MVARVRRDSDSIVIPDAEGGGWDELELDGWRAEFWTSQAVAAGEELLLDYGSDYVCTMSRVVED